MNVHNQKTKRVQKGRNFKKFDRAEDEPKVISDPEITMSLMIFEMCFLFWLHNFLQHNGGAVDPLPSHSLLFMSSGYPNRPFRFLFAT